MALHIGNNKWKIMLNDLVYQSNIYIENLINDVDIPDYVKEEVVEIYNKVSSVRRGDSIIFLAMSDSHYPAEQTATTAYASNKASTIMANQAAKTLAASLNIDFFAHLGDISCGAPTTTPEMLESQIKGFLGYFQEARGTLPVFLAIGNHDNGVYYHKTMTDGNDYIMDSEWMYNNFTARSISNDTVMGNTAYGGYCYRDFNDKKLRVFLLNTCEESLYYRGDMGATLGSQRVWLANALLDLNNKSDASDWGYIVLAHYPADYGTTMPLSELFKAYVDGGSITISVEDGTKSTVSFSGKNNAKFISQFHGHVHNFKTSKLYSYETGSGVQYNAHRICIPNVQFDRENYYTTVGSYTDINFSEDTSYTKTANTADGTSFVVNVINPSDEVIYSFCYGAGYDRAIGYGDISYYNISRSLANATSNSNSFFVASGEPYSETITLDTGYEIKSIVVTMAGVDISSTAISIVDGKYEIQIPNVTGDVIITAKATLRPNFTNLVPISVDTDGSDYYVDGDGYDNGIYLSTTTVIENAALTTTGFIPVKTGAKIIRIAGDGFDADDGFMRILFYNSDFSYNTTISAAHAGSSIWNGRVIEEDSTALTLELYTVSGTGSTNGFNCPYIRICAVGDGADLIVTVDEEITYGGNDNSTENMNIVYNLSNISSSNTATQITNGSSFNTTLTANSGYQIENVKITMGGIDITDDVCTAGEIGITIDITSVVGNIVITANAVLASTTSYTNMIPLSTTSWGGSEIYNSPYGYKTNYRINSSYNEVAATGMCCTGYIPIGSGDIIRIKNVTVAGTQSAYLTFYGLDGAGVGSLSQTILTNGGSISYASCVVEDDVIVVTINTSATYITAMRLSIGVIDETSIITVNEEFTSDDTPSVQTYTITQDLNGVISSNTSTTVTSGSSYSTTLTVANDYEIDVVRVTMGGIDITNSCYSNKVINITEVTGNITIYVMAISIDNFEYTNQLPISTDTDGTTFNSVGYKANSYLSNGNVGSKTGYYTTGFIPVKHGDTIYFKNCTIQAEQSYHRFAAYDSSKAHLTYHQHNTTSSQISSIGTPTYDSDGNMTSLTISGSYWSSVAYIRFCCSYLGADSIVTVNEEII